MAIGLRKYFLSLNPSISSSCHYLMRSQIGSNSGFIREMCSYYLLEQWQKLRTFLLVSTFKCPEKTLIGLIQRTLSNKTFVCSVLFYFSPLESFPSLLETFLINLSITFLFMNCKPIFIRSEPLGFIILEFLEPSKNISLAYTLYTGDASRVFLLLAIT